MKKNAGLAVNGAFLHREAYPEGRVASEYLRAFQLLKKQPRYTDLLSDLEILLAEQPFEEAAGLTARYIQAGKLPRPIWHQIKLPFMAKERLLINFCNIGPVFRANAVVFIHDANVYESSHSYSKAYVIYTKLLNALMGRKYKRIFTPSHYAAQALIKQGVGNSETVRTIHNGVDHVTRHPSETSILAKHGLKKNGYVLGLSNSYKHKNMGVLMDVFDRQNHPEINIDLPLVLFGPDMKETFQDEGIEASDQIVFAGRISDGERRALYENAMCFAYPSKHEGFGLPPVEAMSVGCPVITTRCASIPEICGEAVVYADADNSKDWSKAISAFWQSESLRNQYSDLGKAQASQYTWERAAQALLDDLLEV